MPDENSIKFFNKGAEAWNKWREENSANLADVDFESDLHNYKSMYDMPIFIGYDLSRMRLDRITARNSTFIDCNFSHSSLSSSDLCFSNFEGCNFEKVSMRVTRIGSSSFSQCDFRGADLSYCSAEESKFVGSKFIETTLNHMSLVKSDFSDTVISRSKVYGISAWDLIMDGSEQDNIYISEDGAQITVPTIELAQFISLLINNKKVRDFIDTITSKMVLILGRFSEERKPILQIIKQELASRNYLPVVFDFTGPDNRDVGETIISLASLSRFVIADISSPRSIPQELESIIPKFPSLPVQPLIIHNQTQYGMFERFERYPWVLNKLSYDDAEIAGLVDKIVANCEIHLDSNKN